MSTLDVQVREDGTVLISADQVAHLGAGPGEHLAVEVRATSHGVGKASRGLLQGVLPSVDLKDLQASRGSRLTALEHRYDR